MATASIGVRERMAAASKRIARVKLVDRAATGVITFGGVFIILSVLFIFVFIFGEALPLFRGAKGEKLGTLSLAAAPSGAGTAHGTPLAVESTSTRSTSTRSRPARASSSSGSRTGRRTRR